MKYAIIFIIVLLSGCQTVCHQCSLSDHYDGTRFHFPDVPAEPQSLKYNVYILWKSVSKFPWPKMLENPLPSPVVQPFPRVRFVNHATVLIETGKVSILTDPVYAYRPSPLPIIGPARKRPPGIPFDQLPEIDVVLISHNHYDHLDLPTLKRLERRFHPLFIVPMGNKSLLKAHRISNVIELDWWQSTTRHQTKITMLPAQHSSQRSLLDSNRSLWSSYGISFSKYKYFFAGDTAYNVHFKQIRKRWGKPDLSMLPVGSYNPRKLLIHEHLNPDDAMRAHLDLQSTRSLGIHWLTFQLSDVYPDEVIKDFKKAQKKYGVGKLEFFLLENGQTTA